MSGDSVSYQAAWCPNQCYQPDHCHTYICSMHRRWGLGQWPVYTVVCSLLYPVSLFNNNILIILNWCIQRSFQGQQNGRGRHPSTLDNFIIYYSNIYSTSMAWPPSLHSQPWPKHVLPLMLHPVQYNICSILYKMFERTLEWPLFTIAYCLGIHYWMVKVIPTALLITPKTIL